jgi:ferredoxin-NADP reductase
VTRRDRGAVPASGRPSAPKLLAAATWLTTPLRPDDYLSLVNPLWSIRELRGRVETVQRLTADAVSLVIRPGWGWSAHQPGQYVGIGVDSDGVRYWRTYSVTSPPSDRDDRVSIAVKAVPNGRVSQHLVQRTVVGDTLRLRRPQGKFVLPADAAVDRLLFLTAGSGITPIMGILRSLAARGAMPDVVLLHSAPTPDAVLFGAELRELATRFPSLRLHLRHTATDGRLTLDQLPRWCRDWPERGVWACGPTGLLDDVESHWRAAGVQHRLHVERFQPAAAATASGGCSQVRFTRSGRTITGDQATPLLILGEDAGVVMPSGCRMGICFGCVAPVRSGQVRDLRTNQVHGEAGELIQTCISTAATDVELEL